MFASAVASAHNWNENEFKPLSHEEIEELEKNLNYCSDWNLVRKHQDAASGCSNIRQCTFDGHIFLYSFNGYISGYEGLSKQAGLFSSNFSGKCLLKQNCCIYNSELKNCILEEEAAILYCPLVVGQGETKYGNQSRIVVGPENGGRDVLISIGVTFDEICTEALTASSLPHPPGISSSTPEIYGNCVIIGKNSVLFRCDLIRNSFIGDSCSVTMSVLDTCTLWSDPNNISKGISTVSRSILKNCLFDAGCSAEGCTAEFSYLLDNASLGQSARVVSSVIGPDASVSGGECFHSILGPFIGFHHQSLCIATIWPMGRGNIAYGAKVGANHTGRLNDQECLPGEGMFFGLGSSVKFPFNGLESPYSIISPSTVCLPQKVSFPFSLISTQEQYVEGIPLSLTSIKPAWILQHNPYFLDRSFMKFSQRKKAKCHETGYPILRPSIVDLMLDARERLSSILPTNRRAVYTANDIPGLGKCVLTEKDRLNAIDFYTNYCRRYALQGFLEDKQERQQLINSNKISFRDMVNSWGENDRKVYEISRAESSINLLKRDICLLQLDGQAHIDSETRAHQIAVLCFEYNLPVNSSVLWPVEVLLTDLVVLEKRHADGIYACRAKDDRGEAIIEDYIAVHVKASEDVVVKAARTRLAEVTASVASILWGNNDANSIANYDI